VFENTPTVDPAIRLWLNSCSTVDQEIVAHPRPRVPMHHTRSLMMIRKALMSLVLMLLVAGGGASATEGYGDDSARSKKKKRAEVAAAAAAEAEKEKEKDDRKDFDELIEDMEKVEGLFTFYRDPEKGKVLIELAPVQLDRDYIFSSTIEQATGEKGLYGTIMAGQFVFQWRRLDQRIQFVERNLRFRAEPGSPAARAVAKSFSDSIRASAKIASKPHPERSSVLIDLAEILLGGDLHGLGSFLKKSYESGYSFDKDNSAFVMVKSFPLNSELGTVVRFKASSVDGDSVTIPDARSLSLRFRYSLLELPDSDYMPRLADDRIGYFQATYLDYSSDRPETPYIRHIDRWHLVKKDPAVELSEPVKPITFWLENTIPHEYRGPMTEGVLLWNRAFEKIGFKNAVVVKQQPDDADWDPADARYNTIRWFVAYDASFAIGPSHSNPFTGQILDADIGFSEGILRLGARRRYQYVVDPVTSVSEPRDLEVFGLEDSRLCTYGEQLAEMGSVALDVLAMRPGWSSEEEEEFVRQYVREVTVHEVGHTLGLRHNFRASTIYTMDDLLTAERHPDGAIGASVMDYNPVIVALPGEDQGNYILSSVGSYDEWAIEYGYKPIPGAATPADELPELRRIASRSADPAVPYATDWDAGLGPKAMDPRNTRFDFSADPLAFYDHEIRLVHELWGSLADSLLQDGDGYAVLRRAMGYSWRSFSSGSRVAAKFVGGIYHNADHVGDPNGRLPFTPVPVAEQRRALEFLSDRIWSSSAFAVPAELLQRLQFTRFDDFDHAVREADRFDYPLHDVVLRIQARTLDNLYHPIKLGRIQDSVLMAGDGTAPFSLVDLFTELRSAIWSELASGTKIDSFRRNLQKAHIDRLEKLALTPPEKTPWDAIALARADLLQLKADADRAVRRIPDEVTSAHLKAVSARIEQILNADISLPRQAAPKEKG
jgi:hypothetical protein